MALQHLGQEIGIARKRGIDQDLRAIASRGFDVALELWSACESGLACDDELRFTQRESGSENLLRRNALCLREVTGDAEGRVKTLFVMGAQKIFSAFALLLEIDF